MPSIELSMLGDLSSIAGLSFTLVQWLAGSVTKRRDDERHDNIEQYKEWLNRRNHSEILKQLENNQKVLNQIRILTRKWEISSSDEQVEIARELRTADRTKNRSLSTLIRAASIVANAVSETEDRVIRFEEQYRRSIIDAFGLMELIGIPEAYDISQELRSAFVPLTVKTSDGSQYPSEELMLYEPFLALRGPAGCGKTTLVKYLAIKCTDTSNARNPWRNGVPIHVPLRRLQPNDKGVPKLHGLVAYSSIDGSGWSLPEPSKWIDRLISQKRAVLLLDGVDEIDAKFRDNFWNWINRISRDFAGNRIIITSRYLPQGAGWNPPASFCLGDIEQLSDPAVEALIRKWHKAAQNYVRTDIQRRSLSASCKALLTRLREPRHQPVRELCRTPLICSAICALHWRRNGILPSKRTAVYESCCKMLLEERDLARGVKTTSNKQLASFHLPDKEMLLQRLAYSMMKNASAKKGNNFELEATRSQAESWIGAHIGACENRELPHVPIGEIVDYLIERTGLLREPAKGLVDFPHRSFQEWLAANAAAWFDEAVDLAKRGDDDRWHETIILSSGSNTGGASFGRKIIKQLLEVGKQTPDRSLRRTYFCLAAACFETLPQRDTALEQLVEKVIALCVPPRDLREAKYLSAIGTRVLRHLSYDLMKEGGSQQLACAARTIGLVGDSDAVAMLEDANGYGGDERASITAEICHCPNVHALRVKNVAILLQDLGFVPATSILDRLAEVTDVSPLLARPKLTVVRLPNCILLEDIANLTKLRQLRHLDIQNCKRLRDLSPIAKMNVLEELNIVGCGCRTVDDVSPIVTNQSLRRVVVDSRQAILFPPKVSFKLIVR